MAEPLAFDVVIIGGGPAGQAAALALADHAITIAVIDEQAQAGGQILRQPPRRAADWLPGPSYAPLKDQLARFETLDRVTWLGGRSVLDCQPGRLIAHGIDGTQQITASHILLATGCQDLAVPLPGWTLPGVYAAGGIQALLKSQHILAGERILFAGTHPLQLVIAEQIVRAGGTVAAVLFGQPQRRLLAPLLGAPTVAARRARDLLSGGRAMQTLRRAGVPVHFGTALQRITGVDHVTGADTGAGAIACDAVGLCYGFVPQSALPRMAGAAMVAAGPAGGWRCTHDAWMRSSLPGLYVAGEVTGVAGAAAASASGTIAGLGIAQGLGLITPAAAKATARPARRSLEQHRSFAALLDTIADPHSYLPACDPDTLICRCEDVPLAPITQAIAAGASVNAVKLATRCGMGLCQGRNCEPTLLRLLADAGRAERAGFTARFPARPVAIGDLID
ncbi:NAD(P)/FAD-dependent oxidoreductase [Sphingomonas dokdonensis]|uniref:Hydrogen cyanide synthase subunit HcnB n=1 Tax=Sphingomonas dokdonensis TaxID=344880 RepID=A0A245ZV48_9SPHN|nr:NAD(P)/FAD-dependent oxidoreductase [Sphingomonas dokdonensis]OWK33619.1 hydrogen cyanide synthase subunit HcnB [Sphingomonas dokdonensis]